MTAETPLAQLRKKHARLLFACKALLALVQGEAPSLLEDDHHYDIVTTAIEDSERVLALLTDLEAAPPQKQEHEDVTRVARGETMPATGSTAKTANGSSEALPEDRYYALRDAVTMYAGDGVISDDAVINEAMEHATIAERCICKISDDRTERGAPQLRILPLLSVQRIEWFYPYGSEEPYVRIADLDKISRPQAEGEAAASRPAEPEVDRLQRELNIVKLSVPMEDELSAKIDAMLKYLAMGQGFTLNGIARLLIDCQRRMASDWSEIGNERRLRKAAEAVSPAVEGGHIPYESRSPYGDGHRAELGAEVGDSVYSGAATLPPQQGHVHARDGNRTEGVAPALTDERLAGSEPADSHQIAGAVEGGREDDLRARIERFIVKYDAVINSDAYKGFMAMGWIHGGNYNGESWGDELEALRAALHGRSASQRAENKED